MTPHIHVACAIIEDKGMVLAAQRSQTMKLPLKWEFPGGKLEAGETAEECLIRELHEELEICININRPLPTATYSYDDFTVTLYPFICTPGDGVVTLREHRAVTWVEPELLWDLDWAAADLPIISSYLACRAEESANP